MHTCTPYIVLFWLNVKFPEIKLLTNNNITTDKLHILHRLLKIIMHKSIKMHRRPNNIGCNHPISYVRTYVRIICNSLVAVQSSFFQKKKIKKRNNNTDKKKVWTQKNFKIKKKKNRKKMYSYIDKFVCTVRTNWFTNHSMVRYSDSTGKHKQMRLLKIMMPLINKKRDIKIYFFSQSMLDNIWFFCF